MTDNKYIYILIGNRYAEYTAVRRYLDHILLPHEDDIAGWDMMRASYHKMVLYTMKPYDDEEHKALNAFVEAKMQCPECGVVPTNNEWICPDCNIMVDLRMVHERLEDNRRLTGKEMTIAESREINEERMCRS